MIGGGGGVLGELIFLLRPHKQASGTWRAVVEVGIVSSLPRAPPAASPSFRGDHRAVLIEGLSLQWPTLLSGPSEPRGASPCCSGFFSPTGCSSSGLPKSRACLSAAPLYCISHTVYQKVWTHQETMRGISCYGHPGGVFYGESTDRHHFSEKVGK